MKITIKASMICFFVGVSLSMSFIAKILKTTLINPKRLAITIQRLSMRNSHIMKLACHIAIALNLYL